MLAGFPGSLWARGREFNGKQRPGPGPRCFHLARQMDNKHITANIYWSEHFCYIGCGFKLFAHTFSLNGRLHFYPHFCRWGKWGMTRVISYPVPPSCPGSPSWKVGGAGRPAEATALVSVLSPTLHASSQIATGLNPELWLWGVPIHYRST